MFRGKYRILGCNIRWDASRRMQRLIDQYDDVFVEYSVCLISVAVFVAVI